MLPICSLIFQYPWDMVRIGSYNNSPNYGGGGGWLFKIVYKFLIARIELHYCVFEEVFPKKIVLYRVAKTILINLAVRGVSKSNVRAIFGEFTYC